MKAVYALVLGLWCLGVMLPLSAWSDFTPTHTTTPTLIATVIPTETGDTTLAQATSTCSPTGTAIGLTLTAIATTTATPTNTCTAIGVTLTAIATYTLTPNQSLPSRTASPTNTCTAIGVTLTAIATTTPTPKNPDPATPIITCTPTQSPVIIVTPDEPGTTLTAIFTKTATPILTQTPAHETIAPACAKALNNFMSPGANSQPATIRINQPLAGNLSIKIYNHRGQLVKTLADHAYYTSGQHDFQWDGLSRMNELVPSGIYVVHIEGDGINQHVRIAVVK